ncbi:MAG: lactate utilization protein [Deltaproteobacteria bacterium]|jgi:L-lactate dehydrogenase complex protein LldF|nr:lactate utilization protein [Deltaproteobacteria bacterium]
MNHPDLAAKFIKDNERTNWHNQSLWFVRQKRDTAAKSVENWEQLRDIAAKIKAHSASQLDTYLEQFEKNAMANGTKVHWAKDALEHNQIVLEILKSANVTHLVKSKSMLTEECHMNPFLEKEGIEVIDTDLGERIVQLRNEPPSHIVLPAIHLKKEDVGELFHQKLGTDKGASDPNYLTEAARQHLREKFLLAEAGLTGVNFGIAETGGFVVCTNEGNADLGTALPPIHIASMGIEKLIPKLQDLGVFLRLLARSATGQPITTYSSHYHGPREGKQQHLIIVDNGRSQLLGKETYQKALSCIRCGACLNTCPVYRRSGGHSYGYTIPGPIGSTLALEKDAAEFYTLPFACSLCASCRDVCPVKVDLDRQLYERRRDIVKEGLLPIKKRIAMWVMGNIFGSPQLWKPTGWILRKSLSIIPKKILYSSLNTWGKQRELPEPPKQSFRQWYKSNREMYKK